MWASMIWVVLDVCECVSLSIVLTVLTSKGLADGNGTM